jgi:hypothetical protein
MLFLVSTKSNAQAPNITSLSVTSGITGTSVQINGTNFGSPQGASTISFNGTLAPQISSWTSTVITATVPSAATTGNVIVTVGGINSNGVLFSVIPNISAISPASGPLTTVVQIVGTGFGSTSCSTCLTFNTTSQSPSFWSDTKLISELPSSLAAGPVNVAVNIGGNSSNVVVFTVGTTGTISGTVTQLPNGQAVNGASVSLYLAGVVVNSTTTSVSGAYSFSNLVPGTYSITFSASGFSSANVATVAVVAGGATTENIALATPNLTLLSPSSGPVGTAVTITGTNFGALQGSSSVTFSGITAGVTQWSNATLLVSVPTGATTGSVVVTVGSASSNSLTFTVGVGTIQGSVKNAGVGVVGASVAVLQNGIQKASAVTGSGGAYSIASLVPGTYDMEVTASGLGTQAISGIVAVAGSPTTKNFVLSSPGTISGTITQSNGTTAISGATVNASVGYTIVGTATSNGTGSYSIGTLSAGSYAVTASALGYDTTTKSGQAVTSGGNTTTNVSLASQATINYAYDEAGRLKSIVNSLNNGAIYGYDAAGNITSITTKPATTVTISELTPNAGPVGSTVNIYGSGFSSTLSSDTVTFHTNVNATITSATPTQLVATVPAGATTGPIKVTAPGGTATSSVPFTVTASNGLPTISSFSPGIASPGTTVTISGTNFDPNPSNDGLTVNVSKTSAATATSASITTSLTGIVTSGHVSLSTTVGSYTTQTYLFVPPPGFTAAQVGYTGSVVLGGQVTATLSTANQIGLVAVDVGNGQSWSLNATNNFPSGVPYAVYDPFGNILGSGTIPTGTSSLGGSFSSRSGTCTIMIAPGNATGNVILNTVISFTGSLTVPAAGNTTGPAVQVPSSGNLLLSQNAILTFSASAWQTISFNVLNSTIGSGASSCQMTVYDPYNNIVGTGNCGPQSGGDFIGPFTLSATGLYTARLVPIGNVTGNASISVNNNQPMTSQGSIGGSSVTLAGNVPGQTENLTFAGNATQLITVSMTNDTYTGCGITQAGVNITIYNPDRTLLASYTCQINGNLTRIALPQTGTYTLTLTPGNWTYTGSMTFTLFNVVDTNNSISPGTPITVSTTTIGQYNNLTFTFPFQGNPNPGIAINLTNGSYPGCGLSVHGINVIVYNPDGTVLEQGSCLVTPFFFDTVTPVQSGTYTITVNPTPYQPGQVTVTLYSVPTNVSGSITIGQAGLPFTTVVGQNALITFSNPQTQNVSAKYASGSYTSCTMTVTNSSNQQVGSGSCQGASGTVSMTNLPSGSYSILVNPGGTSTGGLTISATSP